MSVLVMTRVWALDVPHHEQAVLLALADHADDKGGNVYPSIGYIAWKLGYSDRQVRRIVSDLRKRGVLVVTRPGRGKFPPHYRLELSGLPLKTAYREDQRAKMAAGAAATQPNSDILSPLDDGLARGVTPTTATPDIGAAEADISDSRADISGAHPDTTVSAKPSLVNRHSETSPESSEESPQRAAAREGPLGPRRTVDDRDEKTTCRVCGRPAPILGAKRSPPWAPFCSRACQSFQETRASPNGDAEPAVLAAPASPELAVQARGSP